MSRKLVNLVGVLVLALLGILAFDSLRPVATTLRPDLTYVLLRPVGAPQGSLALVQVRRYFRRGGLLGRLAPLASRPFLKVVRFKAGAGQLLEERFLTASLELGPGLAVPFFAEDTLWACSAPTPSTRATLFRWDGAEFQRLPVADQDGAFLRLGLPPEGPKAAALAQRTLEDGGTWTFLAAAPFELTEGAVSKTPATETSVSDTGTLLREGPEGSDRVVSLTRINAPAIELYRIGSQVSAVDSTELSIQLSQPLLTALPR